MINELFAYFEDIETVNSLKLSADRENETYTIGTVNTTVHNGVPDVSWETIIFIAKPRYIWTHGKKYTPNGNGGDYDDSEIRELISGKADKSEIPDISNLATKDDIPDVSNLATQEWVNSQGFSKGGTVDTSKFLDKTSTGTSTLAGKIQIGTHKDNITNAILHIRNVGNGSITGAKVNGACFSVNGDGTASLQHKTYSDTGTNAKNAAVLRMSNKGLQFAVNTGTSATPTEAMYRDVAMKDDIPDTSNFATKDEVPTIPTFKTINGEEITGDGNITISGGGVSYDDTEIRNELAKKADKSEIPTVPDFKTINGESILGIGNITILGGGGDEVNMSMITLAEYEQQKSNGRLTQTMYFIKNGNGDLWRIYYYTTLIARKATEGENVSAGFPIIFPMIFN